MIGQSITVHQESKRKVFPKGLSPANIQAAYDLPSMSRGAGQIVAIVLQCDNPDVANDQAVFRSQFGLPAGQFYKFNEYGQQSNYPPTVKPWGIYVDVSVEMVAAVCPNCTIYLIEANNLDVPDLETATATALSLGAKIISEPWGCDYAGCLDQSYFDKKGVTYVGLGAIPQRHFRLTSIASSRSAAHISLRAGAGNAGGRKRSGPDSAVVALLMFRSQSGSRLSPAQDVSPTMSRWSPISLTLTTASMGLARIRAGSTTAATICRPN